MDGSITSIKIGKVKVAGVEGTVPGSGVSGLCALTTD